MLTVPSVAQLADFSGQPEATYTSYANSALLQATLQFTIITELTPDDFAALSSDDQQLATQGILAMADYIYLRQPYRALIASPLMNETIGSYSYGKSQQEVARNAAALEVTGERTGVTLYDLAVQMLSKRTRAGGVFTGSISVFEVPSARYDGCFLTLDRDGDHLILRGPSDINRGNILTGVAADFNTGAGQDPFPEEVFVDPTIDAPFDINSPVFPGDPGV
jgi:hypothetical protein